MFNKKKKEKQSELYLCEGIKISENIYEQKENRLWTLILKGFMVYLMSAGGICGMLSATKTEHSPLLINAVILVSALYLSCIYYNSKTENIGNTILLIVLIVAGFALSLYINSGFYAVINDINETAKTYFNFTGIKTYAEPISNRYLAVNISMCFIGVVFNILANMWILKKMMYLDVALAALLACILPLYLESEPDLIYVIMLILGATIGYMMRRNIYNKKVNTDSVYSIDKKKNLRYTYNIKAIMSVGIQILVVLVTLVMFMQIVVPKKDYYNTNRTTSLKNQTKEQVGNFIQLGVMGILNRYSHVGGMSSGELGGIGTVNLDYTTDFKLRVTPYSDDTIYLKEQEYSTYKYGKNKWTQDGILGNISSENYYEVNALVNAYNAGYKYSSKGMLEIENVDLMMLRLRPYYATLKQENGVLQLGQSKTIEYYPRLRDNKTKVEQKIDVAPWLEYNANNEASIAKFCEKAGINGELDVDQIVGKVAVYFQKEYPYTLNPGATPMNKDFVNYFLDESKKGFCAHFATAATLIFRYMGIPARYVEGYAVQYSSILEGKLLQDRKYGDYYNGYSDLGETAVVEVDVTDAQAHAWVEIYDEEYGWHPVEITPSSTEEEKSGNMGFWSRFMGFFNTEGAQGGDTGKTPDVKLSEDIFTSDIIKGIVIILALGVCVTIIIPIVKYIIYRRKYNKANINDKLIMTYSRRIKKWVRKNKALKSKVNYKEQIQYLIDVDVIKMSGEDKEKVIDILGKAGFSKELIKEDEDELVRRNLYL